MPQFAELNDALKLFMNGSEPSFQQAWTLDDSGAENASESGVGAVTEARFKIESVNAFMQILLPDMAAYNAVFGTGKEPLTADYGGAFNGEAYIRLEYALATGSIAPGAPIKEGYLLDLQDLLIAGGNMGLLQHVFVRSDDGSNNGWYIDDWEEPRPFHESSDPASDPLLPTGWSVLNLASSPVTTPHANLLALTPGCWEQVGGAVQALLLQNGLWIDTYTISHF